MQISPPSLPSNQKFGWFFVGVFILIATHSLWRGSTIWAWVLYALSFILFIITALSPERLAPVNRLWFKFGILLGKVISPITIGIMFFALITPIALVTRIFGRDELKLRKRLTDSYWINRIPTGPATDSFKNQY